MVFTSHIFIFYFLPVVLLIYYLLPGRRNLFLLCVSYIFYGWWNPRFVLLMLFATFVNYTCGSIIVNSGTNERRRLAALTASVVVSLGTLGFFKYFMFFSNNLNFFLDFFGSGALPVIKITLPVGISFYIFQSLSYSIDLYRRKSPPVRSFLDFACFVSMFPQLIAGPIIRYNTVAEQLINRTHNIDKFSSGVSLFILGFAKKIMLANIVGKAADAVFAAEAPGTGDVWFGITMYAFQIYFDFSAYSDMAIGLGRMLGFEFPRNFNAPYLAESITDFWRRWHISLSTFLRDYLYFPLGGNRKGKRRTYINLAVVMLVGGFWHGANWTFIFWGAFHGALLAFERWLGKKSIYAALPRPFRVLITFVLILFSWVLFRSPDIDSALNYFGVMFGMSGLQGGSVLLAGEIYTRSHLIILAVCIFLTYRSKQAFDWVENITWTKAVMLIFLFCFSLMTMFVQEFNPFLYFQF